MGRFLVCWLCAAAAAAADAPAAAPSADPATGATKPADATATPATRYTAGVQAKVFILPADTDWPPASLPKAPGEAMKLTGLPQVSGDPVGPEKSRRANTLVESQMGILDGVRFYAVQFSGWIYAPEDGDYGFVVRSNGPYLFTIEGQEIARSAYFFDYSKYLHSYNGLVVFDNLPADAKLTNTTQGTAKLTAHRYYRIELTCYAQHGNLAPGTTAKPEVLKAMGAELATFMTTPGGETAPLKVYLAEQPTPDGGK